MCCAPLFVYALIIAQRTVERTLYMDAVFCFAKNNTRNQHATYSVFRKHWELFTPRYIPQASNLTPT